MTPELLTSITGVAVAVIAGIVVPRWLAHREQGTIEEQQTTASWAGITQALQEERDNLQKRLDGQDTRQAEQISRLEKRLGDQIVALQRTIDEQQSQLTEQGKTINRLYAELGRRHS